MGGVGAIIATLGGAALYKMNQAYPFWMGSAAGDPGCRCWSSSSSKSPKSTKRARGATRTCCKSLKEVVRDEDKSALRILLAIFFWFVAYNAIEAFFTLYAQNHLGLPASDGARLLGQLSLIFVLFALPAGLHRRAVWAAQDDHDRDCR